MQNKEVLSLITIFFTIVTGTLLAPEIKEYRFKCSRLNTYIALTVNLENQQKEMVAIFTENSCSTFGYMRCSYNSLYYYLSIPTKHMTSKIVSYHCWEYLLLNFYPYDSSKFIKPSKADVTLTCPSSVDFTSVILKYSDGHDEVVGIFKSTQSKCGLGFTCAVADYKYSVNFTKNNNTGLITNYTCTSYLTTTDNNNDVARTDIQVGKFANLKCYRTSNITIKVTKNSGKSKSSQDYSENYCIDSETDITCSFYLNDLYLTTPVSLESRKIESLACLKGHVEDVIFYDDASEVQCETPKIKSSGDALIIDCKAIQVFPALICTLYENVGGTKSVLQYDLLYTSLLDGLYFNTSCKFEIQTSVLKLGYHQFTIVTSTVNDSFTQTQNSIEKIFLDPFQPTLDSTCMNSRDIIEGYVLVNTVINCTCLKNASNDVFGQVVWYKDNTLMIPAENSNASATITLSFTNAFDSTYECVAVPILGKASSIKYKPRIAFGPTTIFISSRTIEMNKCSKILISSWILASDVIPSATLNYTVNDSDAFEIQVNRTTLFLNISLTAHILGQFEIVYTGKNNLFQIIAQNKTLINVTDASTTSPRIIVNNGRPIKDSQDTVNITCFNIDNGVAAKNVTLQCLNDSITVAGSKITIFKSFTRENHGATCKCSIFFVDTCYASKLTEFTIEIAYGPNSMEVSDMYLSLELCYKETVKISVPNNSFFPSVNFTCLALTPDSVFIDSQNTRTTTTSTDFGITGKKEGDYIIHCKVENSLFREIFVEKYISVSIKELKSRLPVLTMLNKQLPLLEGAATNDVKISCNIPEGYTSVRYLNLTCFGPPVILSNQPVVVERALTRLNNNMTCTCEAVYTSECYVNRFTSLDVKVYYGPNQVFPYTKTININKCEETTIGCFVLKSDISPEAKFMVSTKNTSAITFNEMTKRVTSFSQLINITAHEVGDFVVECSAENSVFSSVKASTDISVSAKENVIQPPEIILNQTSQADDKNYLRNLSITCRAPESKRAFSNMTISCNRQNFTSNSTSNTMYRDLTFDKNGTNCSCTTEYYDACNGRVQSIEYVNIQCFTPILTIADGKSIVAQNSETNVKIVCTSFGNKYFNSTLTLACLEDPVSVTGTSITVYRNISKEDNGMVCNCTLNATFCSEPKLTSINLNIFYDQGVSNLTANEQSLELEVDEGETISFDCFVNSNPMPHISIQTDNKLMKSEPNFNKMIIVESGKNIWQQRNVIENCSCYDTNRYICVAQNEKTHTQTNRSVHVLIRCPMKRFPFETSVRKFLVSSEKEIEILMKFYGHPLPKNFTLFKGSRGDEVNKTKYSVTFTEINRPIILVSLRMKNLVLEDFSDYSLIISNGIGNSLFYEFYISQEPDGEQSDTGTIVLATLLTIALLTILAIIIVVCFKKHKKEGQESGGCPHFDRNSVVANLEQGYYDADYPSGSGDDLVTDVTRFGGANADYESYANENQARRTESYANENQARRTVPQSESYANENQAGRTGLQPNVSQDDDDNLSIGSCSLNLEELNNVTSNMEHRNKNVAKPEDERQLIAVSTKDTKTSTTQARLLSLNYTTVNNMKVINCSTFSGEIDNEQLQTMPIIQEDDVPRSLTPSTAPKPRSSIGVNTAPPTAPKPRRSIGVNTAPPTAPKPRRSIGVNTDSPAYDVKKKRPFDSTPVDGTLKNQTVFDVPNTSSDA